jgi:hypothetical protein
MLGQAARLAFFGALGALLLGAPVRGQASSSCIRTNWFGVCDFTKHECILSSAFCKPYGSFYGMLTSAPFSSNQNEPWTIYVDVYDRSDGVSSCESISNSTAYDTCKSVLTNTNTSDQFSWNISNVVVRRNYLTIAPLQPTSRFQIQKQFPVQYDAGALCRCLEFTGYHITLTGMHCDVSQCIDGFRKSYQYNGDDGVLVAFSGGSAAFSTVSDCVFTSQRTTTYDFQGLTTGVRFGSDDADAQYIDQVFLKNNIFENIDFSYAFWDVGNQFPDENITIETTDDACLSPPCIVTYKQAYRDAPPLYWDGNGSQYPDYANLFNWSLVNMSAVLPPSFAYLRREAVAPGLQPEVCQENTGVIVAGVLFLLGTISLLIVIEACWHRRYDPHDPHDPQMGAGKKEK